MKKIESTSNPLIKKYAKLKLKKNRDKENLILVEGRHMFEVVKNKDLIVDVISTDESIATLLVNDKILKNLSSTVTPQDVIVVCKKPSINNFEGNLLALDNIQDPGNLGTLIRTARAFEYGGVIVSGVDIYNPKVIRSTQGAIFEIPVVQTDDISKYFDGYDVFGGVLDESAVSYKGIKPKSKFIIVIGNEANGISQRIQEKLSHKIYIPIRFESLNAAVAGAILLNEYRN